MSRIESNLRSLGLVLPPQLPMPPGVVLLDWASAYWSFQRYARVVADATAKGKP